MTHIVVINRHNAKIVYAGQSEGNAAVALEPGTVYGKGQTYAQALSHAMLRLAAVTKAVSDH